ncbi:hypothetical protein O1611_g4804 [Lasiodiplodia mahajangana]|uniref:Uncharacterized protein n=1 Tax=Lasiodiplodia mahajangana TaxID=1108764 RepID=A0ACC2JMT1_9PEZI|nr:hypothetical protein O1611_g4804 [Lasiodiplodia mahajangana]
MSQQRTPAAQQAMLKLRAALDFLAELRSGERSHLAPNYYTASSVHKFAQSRDNGRSNKKSKSQITDIGLISGSVTTTVGAYLKETDTKVMDMKAGEQPSQHTPANMEHILTKSGAWAGGLGDNETNVQLDIELPKEGSHTLEIVGNPAHQSLG